MAKSRKRKPNKNSLGKRVYSLKESTKSTLNQINDICSRFKQVDDLTQLLVTNLYCAMLPEDDQYHQDFFSSEQRGILAKFKENPEFKYQYLQRTFVMMVMRNRFLGAMNELFQDSVAKLSQIHHICANYGKWKEEASQRKDFTEIEATSIEVTHKALEFSYYTIQATTIIEDYTKDIKEYDHYEPLVKIIDEAREAWVNIEKEKAQALYQEKTDNPDIDKETGEPIRHDKTLFIDNYLGDAHSKRADYIFDYFDKFISSEENRDRFLSYRDAWIDANRPDEDDQMVDVFEAEGGTEDDTILPEEETTQAIRHEEAVGEVNVLEKEHESRE